MDLSHTHHHIQQIQSTLTGLIVDLLGPGKILYCAWELSRGFA